MRLSVLYEDQVVPIEVEPNEDIENVKAIIEAEMSIPVAEQQIWYGNEKLEGQHTLADWNIAAEALLVIQRVPQAAAPSPAGSPAPTADDIPAEGVSWRDIPGDIDPQMLHRILQVNPQMLEEARHDRALVEAARDPDPSALRRLMIRRQLDAQANRLEQGAMRERLRRNPQDTEAQERLERSVQQDNVRQNFELAMEHNPESFGRVAMLYVPCEVNGREIQAFVDSGAQMTIMSRQCAERCGLMSLLDTKFAGQAVGVGKAPILGRIHLAQLKIGDTYFNCSITVIDQEGMEFIFGLDMLRRHQCSIDLKQNRLVLEGARGSEEVEFLPEHAIRRAAFAEEGGSQSTSATGSDSAAAAGGGGARGASDAAEGERERVGRGSAAGAGGSTAASSNLVDPAALERLMGGGNASSSASRAASSEAELSSEEQGAKIRRVMELGFSEQEARSALEACGWNEDRAVESLM